MKTQKNKMLGGGGVDSYLSTKQLNKQIVWFKNYYKLTTIYYNFCFFKLFKLYLKIEIIKFALYITGIEIAKKCAITRKVII